MIVRLEFRVPEGNKTSHSVVEVAKRMLQDPDCYGL